MNILMPHTRFGILSAGNTIPAGDGIAANGFQGVAIVQIALIDQIDIQMDGFQGVAVVQTALIDQIDIQMDGFQGVAIVQTTYP